MANNTIQMLQIRRIFQLLGEGVGKRKISRITGISRNTVREYLIRAERIGISPGEVNKLNDMELGCLFYSEGNPPRADEHEKIFLWERIKTYVEELHDTGITRYLLWEEYRQKRPEGYGYTRFCHFINQYQRKHGCVMQFEHKPGEKLMIDFAGELMRYINGETGEEIKCQVFVAVFPYSNYSYVEAVHSQKQEDFIHCITGALNYFGGAPSCILSDNLKSVVKRANRYEPVFTTLAEQLALHYDTTLMATRAGKPKDKPHVESAIRTLYTRIYAPLRHKEFFTLADLNKAILEQLEVHHSLPFQRKEHCRRKVFMTQEKPLLKPLPQNDFEVKQAVEAKVQRNYHVILGQDWHQYSVPFEYAGEYVKIIYTRQWVEIYRHGNRIAIHARNTLRNGYSTLREHMPVNHQHQHTIRGWNENDFKRMAGQIGPFAHAVIEKVLSSRMFHEQTYNSCLGILRLGKKYGEDRLEAACQRVSGLPRVNYRLINNILKNNLDKKTDAAPSLFPIIAEHENIRGASNYS